MAKLTAQSTYSSLPPWAKGTVVVLSIVIVAGIGFGIYRGIKKAIEKAKESKESRESKQELQNLESQGIKPTISEAEASAKVSQLVESANGCDPLGTGATTIIQVIKSLKNQADWYLVNQQFATKTWDECGWGAGDVTGSLSTLLTAELDGGQMDEIRSYLASIKVNL